MYDKNITENSMQKETAHTDIPRRKLAEGLLEDIKNICVSLQNMTSRIESETQCLYETLYNNTKGDIQEDIDKYKSNLQTVKMFSSEITTRMNKWYEFTASSNELGKLLFPARYHLKRRKLQSFIKNINNQIYDISVENRIIKERLTNWEHELEITTIQQIRLGNDYRDFTVLSAKKDELLSSLKYLLPTIQDACPVIIDTRRSIHSN